MTLLDTPPDAQSRQRLWVWIALIALVLLIVGLWYNFRYYPETRAAEHFFDALIAGNTADAYKLWKAGPSYSMPDFLADWGPNGYYGPVKSYQIKSATSPRGASGVIVTVEVSPYSPFPAPDDVEKSRRTKTISIWVESKDKSFSFPP